MGAKTNSVDLRLLDHRIYRNQSSKLYGSLGIISLLIFREECDLIKSNA